MAEVGAALAGFTGVISVFGRRAERDDPRAIHYRVRGIIEQSLCVVIFSLVPYLFVAVLPSEAAAWRLASALFAASWLSTAIQGLRRGRRLVGRSVLSVAPVFFAFGFLVLVIGAIVLVLNAAGVALGSPSAAYIVGLFCPLLLAVLLFLRIVVSAEQ